MNNPFVFNYKKIYDFDIEFEKPVLNNFIDCPSDIKHCYVADPLAIINWPSLLQTINMNDNRVSSPYYISSVSEMIFII